VQESIRSSEVTARTPGLIIHRNLGELDALKGRSCDAVIDNPTTLPFWVRDAGHVLREATGLYVFISTISAFRARVRDPIQLIDARDLAEWTVRMTENRTTGTSKAVPIVRHASG